MTSNRPSDQLTKQCRCPHCGFHVGHSRGIFVDTGKALKIYLCPSCCKTSTLDTRTGTLTVTVNVKRKPQHPVPAVKPTRKE